MTLLHEQQLLKLRQLVKMTATVIVEQDGFSEALHDELPPKPVFSFTGTIREHYNEGTCAWHVHNTDSGIVFCLGHVRSIILMQGPTKAFIRLHKV